MKIRSYIDKVVANGKPEEMEKLSDMLTEIIYSMKEHHHDKYEHYKMCLYKLAYGNILNEDISYKIVKSMKPLGEHWDIDSIRQVKSSMGLTYNDYDLYTVMNSLANDYGEIIDKEDVTTYVKMAKAFIEDEDATKDKVFVYFTTIPKTY